MKVMIGLLCIGVPACCSAVLMSSILTSLTKRKNTVKILTQAKLGPGTVNDWETKAYSRSKYVSTIHLFLLVQILATFWPRKTPFQKFLGVPKIFWGP